MHTLALAVALTLCLGLPTLAHPTPRIVGGSPASPSQYPMLVSLGYNGVHSCTGTILTPTVILTAAHCMNNGADSPSAWTVRAGSIYAAGAQTRSVASISLHPSYAPATKANDLALMTLSSPLVWSDAVYAALLPTTPFDATAPGNVTVAGWGGTAPAGGSPPDSLLAAAMDPQPMADCVALGSPAVANALCAVPIAGSDTCQGDSGGPMIVGDRPNSLYIAAGVLSFGGPSCGTYSVYIESSAFLPWIQSVAPSGQYDAIIKTNPNTLTSAVYTGAVPSSSSAVAVLVGDITVSATTSLLGPLVRLSPGSSLTIAASFAVPAVLRIENSASLTLQVGASSCGAFVLEPSASLRIILTSGSPSSLAVARIAGPAGSLRIVQDASYTPIVGTEFTVLTYAILAAEFAAVDFVPLASSRRSARALAQTTSTTTDVARASVSCSTTACVVTLLEAAAPSPSSDDQDTIFLIIVIVSVILLAAIAVVFCYYFCFKPKNTSGPNSLQRHQVEHRYAAASDSTAANANANGKGNGKGKGKGRGKGKAKSVSSPAAARARSAGIIQRPPNAADSGARRWGSDSGSESHSCSASDVSSSSASASASRSSYVSYTPATSEPTLSTS